MDDPFKDMDPELLKKANDPDADLTQTELDALLKRSEAFSYNLVKTEAPNTQGLPGCWFGGPANLPSDIEWPSYEVPWDQPFELPLHHVLQLKLSALPELHHILPKSGTLHFFLDLILWQAIPYGSEAHKMSARVIYTESEPEVSPLRSMPSVPTDKMHAFIQDFKEFVPYWLLNYYPEDMIGWGAQHNIEKIITFPTYFYNFKNVQFSSYVGEKFVEMVYGMDENPHYLLGAERLHGEMHRILFNVRHSQWNPENVEMVFWIPEKDLIAHEFDNVITGEKM